MAEITGRSVLIIGTIISALAAPAIAQSPSKWSVCDGTIAEPRLRRLATHIVVPEYPKQDIVAKVTGIAIAELCVPPGASVASPIRIVSAPSEAIANSMRKALAQWRFGTITSTPNSTNYVSYASKIIFYFVEQNGQFVVLSPAESFYVGPRFASGQQADASR